MEARNHMSDQAVEIADKIDGKKPVFKSRTVSVVEAGQILGLSRMGAYRGIWAGDIPHIRIGRSIRVPLAKLNELVPPVETQHEGEAA
jgi:excisionase family DNA binding protein